MVGEKVVLRTRMSAGDAHYAGELVEGAHIVTAWGDVGTELAIRLFGDDLIFFYSGQRCQDSKASCDCESAGDL